MDNKEKCSSKQHGNHNAVSFCQECKVYMCNKCDNFHSELLSSHHKIYLNKGKVEEIFTGLCQENNHNYELKYYCKTHNQLVCVACIAKIKDNSNGKHGECLICNVEEISEDKKKNLSKNLEYLEKISQDSEKSLESVKERFSKMETKKEELITKIQKIFTKIRNTINEREDELLLSVDNQFKCLEDKDNIIKQSERLPKKVKQIIQNGKSINKDNNKKISAIVNDCINIENSIEEIKKMNQKMSEFKCIDMNKIDFRPNENELDDFVEKINKFGKIIFSSFSFKTCPNDLDEKRKYVLSGSNNNRLTKIGQDQNMGTICENVLNDKKEYKWKIKILNTKNRYIMIGVAPIDFDIYKDDFHNGWYLSCYNSTLCSGPPYNYSDFQCKLGPVNNEVIVIMNTLEKTLKFLVDDKDVGPQYTDIPTDKLLSPAVILYSQNDSIEIVEC